ncbi:MAG TPA: sigma-70 family RNA polymerase sigma factor [Candidatus Polarisedimenticolaceae bacterium]|nr:sigma-70 family RNA polymerase sigma factor [Candidatus Polarisedimenticolaceae bacterium]
MSELEPPNVTERDLVGRLCRREPAAFEQLVRCHGGPMLAVARRILRSEEEAKDAVQDAFVSIFKSIDSFTGEARLSTWLHSVAVNAALMRIRRRASRPEVALDDLLPRFLDDGHRAEPGPAWTDTAETALAREELQRQVRNCIDRLPEGHRTVLMLRDIEGLDGQETAKLLGITPNAVKVRLHRARMALRTLLDPLHGGRQLVGASR